MRSILAISVILLTAGISFTLGVSGCTKDKALSVEQAQGCDTLTYTYSNDIAPIFAASCATGLGPGTGCHDAWIFDYNNVKSQVDNGNIQYEVLDVKTMPVPGNSFGIHPLTDTELQKITCWILSGAPEN